MNRVERGVEDPYCERPESDSPHQVLDFMVSPDGVEPSTL